MKLAIRMYVDLVIEAPELMQPVNFDEVQGQLKQLLEYNHEMNIFTENTPYEVVDWQYKIEEHPHSDKLCKNGVTSGPEPQTKIV